MNLYAFIRRAHVLACPSCKRGDSWPVGWRHVQIRTAQTDREAAALRALRNEQADRRRDRRAVVLAAARGVVRR